MKSFPKDNPMFEPFLSKAQREALDEMSMDLQEERGLMPKTRVEAARDKLIKAGKKMLQEGKFDGEELHGKRKQL